MQTTQDSFINDVAAMDKMTTTTTFDGTTNNEVDKGNDETVIPTPIFDTIIAIVVVLVVIVIVLLVCIVVLIFLVKRCSDKKGNEHDEVVDIDRGGVDYSTYDSLQSIKKPTDQVTPRDREESILYKSLNTFKKELHFVDSGDYTVVDRGDDRGAGRVPSPETGLEDKEVRSEERYETVPETNELNLPLQSKEDSEKKGNQYEQIPPKETQQGNLNHTPCSPVYAIPSISVGIEIQQAKGKGYDKVSRYEQIGCYETPATYEMASTYQSAVMYEKVEMYEAAATYEKVTSSFNSGYLTPGVND